MIPAEALFFAYVDRFRETREGSPGDEPAARAVESSWHLSEHEPEEAMWRLCSPRQEAVAAQST